MPLPLYWYNALSFLVVGWAIVKYAERRRRNPKGLPLPPGPKGYPIIGCFFENSAPYPWVQYAHWGKEYGDMYYFESLRQPFLILNSLKRTNDLFEKRSKIYSDRIWSTMVLELTGWDLNFGLVPYGIGWRKCRRQFHEFFNLQASNQYVPIQTEEAKTLLKAILADNDPKSLARQVRRTFAATIMRIAYGIRVDSNDNEYVIRAEESLGSLAQVGIFGSFLVDYIPVLKYIPTWFPGAGFQRKAAYWKEVNHQVRTKPFALVKEQLATNSAPPSVATQLIQKLPSTMDDSYATEQRVGEDVTSMAFIDLIIYPRLFLAMAMHPDVMRQAQDEIDRVVGPDRLPTVEDQPSLPFAEAICKELLRWHNVVPTAIAHTTSEDDEYDGYFIPKGTIVYGNAWGILHDETIFEKPFEFMPSRYIKDGEFVNDLSRKEREGGEPSRRTGWDSSNGRSGALPQPG